MEVPSLGVELDLLLPAYATATATPDLSSSVTYTTASSEWGQESNPRPHGYKLGLLSLSHNRNSSKYFRILF